MKRGKEINEGSPVVELLGCLFISSFNWSLRGRVVWRFGKE